MVMFWNILDRFPFLSRARGQYAYFEKITDSSLSLLSLRRSYFKINVLYIFRTF